MTTPKNWSAWTPKLNHELMPAMDGGTCARVALMPPSSAGMPPESQESMRLRHNLMLGITTWLPVAMVAKEWRVSSRRIRALLLAGRLQGRQQENGYWEVAYPYTLTEGRRGPTMRKYAPVKPALRLV